MTTVWVSIESDDLILTRAKNIDGFVDHSAK